MTKFTLITCTAGYLTLIVGYLITRKTGKRWPSIVALPLGFILVTTGATNVLTHGRATAHTKAWAPVAATYDITTPDRGVPPRDPADAPVPVPGRVNGNPAACQAFHTGHTVKVTCNGTEADRR